MRYSLDADLDTASLPNRESPARRIGVILSIVFLVSVGMVAKVTSARAGDHTQAAAGTAVTTLPSTAR